MNSDSAQQSEPIEPGTQILNSGYSVRELVHQFRIGVPRNQLARLSEQTPVNTAVTISLVILISVFVVSQVWLPWMLVWAAAQLGLILDVFLRWQKTTRHGETVSDLSTKPSRSGLHRALLWALLSSGLWGSLTFFLPAVPPHIQMALILCMGGMAAGASTTLAAVPQVAIAYILGCGLPVTVYYSTIGGRGELLLALVFAIFTAAMLGTSQIVYAALLKQFRTEERVRQLQSTVLKQKIATIVNKATSVDEALQSCLDAVCDYTGWPAAHVYLPADDGTNQLVPSGIWHMDDEQRFEGLCQVTGKTRFGPGEGFPGRILEAGKPLWKADGVPITDLPLTALDAIADTEFPRSEAIYNSGVKAIVGFPIPVGTENVAVLEFFSDHTTKPSDHLMGLLAYIAERIGRSIERYRSDKNIERSEKKFRTLVEGSSQGLIVHSNYKFIYANEVAAHDFGYTVDEFLALNSIEEVVRPKYREKMVTRAAARYAGKDMVSSYDFPGLHKNGHPLAIRARTSAIEWEGDTATLVTTINYTKLKQVEGVARREEARAKEYLDVVGSIIFAIDVDEKITLMNDAGCRLLECEEGQAVGQNAFDTFLPEESRNDARAVFRRWVNGEDVMVSVLENEVTTRRGTARVVRWQFAALKDSTGRLTGLLGSGEDVTEHRRTEEQLRQAQKMEAIGQLTSGLAHDLNNMLAIVMGNLELVGEEQDIGNANRKHLLAAIDGAQCAADLNRQLLTFSRQQVLAEQISDINDIVRKMLGLLKRTLGDEVEIETDFSDQDCICEIDPAQLESAIVNLAINARDAMDGSGRLRIETSVGYFDESSDVSRKQSMIRISVSDNGSGMTAEVKEHAVEPFFTTKTISAGSGLGLSMIYGFITQSGGKIEIDSTPSIGTTIHMMLPATAPDSAVQDVTDSNEIPIANSGEVVIVVEDQQAVRNVMVAYLDSLGYEVLQAESGEQALKILESIHSVDLILSDMILPRGMNGSDVVAKATAMLPDLKFLYMSGNPGLSERNEQKIQGPMLRKPFRRKELARAVRDRLDNT